MFSGIIEKIGSVVATDSTPHGQRLTVAIADICAELRPGDSIALNGVCFTVVVADSNTCAIEMGEATLAKTTAGEWHPGQRLNIERAMRADARLDGHIVQGHVDGIAVVASGADKSAGPFRLVCDLPTEFMRCVVHEGSIAIDGVSLTVAELATSSVVCSIVPYTSSHTTLTDLQAGDRVNIELDIIGRYVERLLQGYRTA